MIKALYMFLLILFLVMQLSIYEATTFTKLFQGVFLVFSILYTIIYIFRSRENPFINRSLIFVLLCVISFFWDGTYFGTTSLKAIVILFSSCITFYLWHKRGNVRYNNTFIVFTILALLYSFFSTRSIILSENELAYGVGYMVLPIIPLSVYLWRDKENRVYLSMLVTLFLTMIDGKRGAILGAVIFIVFYLFMDLRRNQSVKKFLGIVLLFGVISVGSFYVYKSSELLQNRVSETLQGETSNRDVIYGSLWQEFKDATIDQQLFGRGFKTGTIRVSGGAAHNDWLQVLTDMGLVTALVYLGLFILLIKASKDIIDPVNRILLRMIIVLWLIVSFFSMFVYSLTSLPYFILIGMILGDNERQKFLDGYESEM